MTASPTRDRTRSRATGPLVLALALAVAACPAPDAEDPQPGPATPAADVPPRSPAPDGPQAAAETRPWTREGLAAQPRMDELGRGIPPDLGYEPATTDWRVSDRELPNRFSRPAAEEHGEWDTPGRLLGDMLAALGFADPLGEDVWEITLRVMETGEDEAVAVLQEWGFKDDAIAGRDLRLVLGRAPGSWYVTNLEERYHCARGVADDGRCF